MVDYQAYYFHLYWGSEVVGYLSMIFSLTSLNFRTIYLLMYFLKFHKDHSKITLIWLHNIEIYLIYWTRLVLARFHDKIKSLHCMNRNSKIFTLMLPKFLTDIVIFSNVLFFKLQVSLNLEFSGKIYS
jgi:hypothetical protein